MSFATKCDKCGIHGTRGQIEFISATFEDNTQKHFCRNCWTLMEEAEAPQEFPDGLK